MKTIYLDKLEGTAAAIARQAFPDYTGRRFRVQAATTFNPNTNNWDGGSRTYQRIISRTGAAVTVPECGNPFVGFAKDSLEIPPGTIVVEHSIFCGKDMGLRFLVRPDEMDTLALPAPVELTEEEKLVLRFTASRVSSYNGRNRKQMAAADGFPVDHWEATQEALKARGFLNKAGAITPAGRNAIGETREAFGKRIY